MRATKSPSVRCANVWLVLRLALKRGGSLKVMLAFTCSAVPDQ